MSKNNSYISPERKQLLEKADAYWREFESVREDLEESTLKFGKNVLIVSSIGLGIALSYKLLSESSDKEENKENFKNKYKRKPSRFGSAFKTLAIPFFIGIAKSIVLPDLNKSKQQSNGGNP
ncbi:hypothetical protein HZR84_08680 [Hyphobacterium sp. CCMP332]|nr:hypothetical protein HZR84_08680 [Hyphobacterium sp. CCMP332]